jgi:hypothetical protein
LICLDNGIVAMIRPVHPPIRPGSRKAVTHMILSLTVFLSAFLLFLVQPLTGKAVLPWFGGVPAVWNACLLFFQLALFLGYTYAHASARFLDIRGQAGLHSLLTVAAVFFLPILPDASLAPVGSEHSILKILKVLALSVGPHFFILAGTGSLLQVWRARLFPEQDTWSLYAVSNAGSFAALLSYPFLIERMMSGTRQSWLWSLGFVIYALMILLGTVRLFMLTRGVAEGEAETTDTASTPPAPAPQGLWLIWSALGVVLYMAVTNQLCQELSSMPLLWVLPLAIYLLSFVVAFSGVVEHRRGLLLAVSLIAAPAMFIAIGGAATISGLSFLKLSLMPQILILTLGLGLLCLACHNELYRLRPDRRYLTRYYLSISGGGLLGGAYVTLAAPLIFNAYLELHVGLALICLLLLTGWYVDQQGERKRSRQVIGGAALAWCLLSSVLMFLPGGVDGYDLKYTERNFFGVLRVFSREADNPEYNHLVLMHGPTKHGAQYTDPRHRAMPATYFGPFTGAGLAFRAALGQHGERPLSVGIIGLGVGALSGYGRRGDTYRFYEIDPAVIEVARGEVPELDTGQQFTYLRDCPADVSIVTGDARLELQRELTDEPRGFDIFVLDAFSGGAIPVHLLTREAFELYKQHLGPDAIIAVHISNNSLNLKPVVFGAARELGFKAICLSNQAHGFADEAPIDRQVSSISTWVILFKSNEYLAQLAELSLPLMDTRELSVTRPFDYDFGDFRDWTDDYNNIFQVLRSRIGD